MEVQFFLTQRRTRCGVDASSKKRALEAISQILAEDQPSLDADELFRNLTARERLGSTGLGQGIAIPHCRMSGCSHTVGALITLNSAIDYEAIDGKPVDLIFALVVPEDAHDEHLQTLATIAERLHQDGFPNSLRRARDAEALFKAAISSD